jgi:hypothetical protein
VTWQPPPFDASRVPDPDTQGERDRAFLGGFLARLEGRPSSAPVGGLDAACWATGWDTAEAVLKTRGERAAREILKRAGVKIPAETMDAR